MICHKVMAQRPNVLLMDEPTNDLDAVAGNDNH